MEKDARVKDLDTHQIVVMAATWHLQGEPGLVTVSQLKTKLVKLMPDTTPRNQAQRLFEGVGYGLVKVGRGTYHLTEDGAEDGRFNLERCGMVREVEPEEVEDELKPRRRRRGRRRSVKKEAEDQENFTNEARLSLVKAITMDKELTRALARLYWDVGDAFAYELPPSDDATEEELWRWIKKRIVHNTHLGWDISKDPEEALDEVISDLNHKIARVTIDAGRDPDSLPFTNRQMRQKKEAYRAKYRGRTS
jgi:hypothetical protein